jgi:hypothetical protein
MLADPSALFDSLLEVSLQPAARSGGAVAREARAVEQAVEQDELAVAVVLDHRRQIELDVGGAREPGGVAQQPKLAAVGDEAPERAGAVQVLLHQRVRAASPSLGALVERLVDADDVDGRCIGRRAGAMRDRVALAPDDHRARLIDEVEAEALEKRNDPGSPRQRRDTLVGMEQASLEGIPERASVGERGLHLVGEPTGERRLAVDDEVLGALAGDAPGGDAVEQICWKETAFDRDRDVGHQAPPAGTST